VIIISKESFLPVIYGEETVNSSNSIHAAIYGSEFRCTLSAQESGLGSCCRMGLRHSRL
jgi:hypothetical protein